MGLAAWASSFRACGLLTRDSVFVVVAVLNHHWFSVFEPESGQSGAIDVNDFLYGYVVEA